jgi:subtilisin family serine protease
MHRVFPGRSPLRRVLAATLLIWVAVVGLAPATHRSNAQDPPLVTGRSSSALQGEYASDQILVRFRSTAKLNSVDEILVKQGLSRAGQVKRLRIDVLRLPASLTVEKALESLRKLPDVEFAEPNYIVRVADTGKVNLAGDQWATQRIAAEEAWLITEGDPAVVIAVIDTGVDYRHHQLAPNIWVNNKEIPGNGIDDDGNGFIDDVKGWDFANNDSDPLDDHFHGTHVAGISAAVRGSSPTDLVGGVCPHCRIMPVKVLNAQGSGTMDAIANGITYAADNGARVINMSLGATQGSATLQAAVEYAWGKGLVVVAAAGNDGAEELFYPAAYAQAIAVASTNVDDYKSCYSNYGNNFISVAAPGELIYSTTPQDSSGNDTYKTISGTSMASPHVAGLAGLLFSQDTTRTNSQVRALIESTTEDLGPLGSDAYFGSGRINAYRAVQGDTAATTPPATGFIIDSPLATGYANARKIVRDAAGTIHVVWHGKSGGQYQILYSSSVDSVAWTPASVVFSSSAETYNPALTTDGSNLFVAFASMSGAAKYQTFFTAKSPAPATGWGAPLVVAGGADNAVRPDLYYDPSGGKLHLVATSLDDAHYVYYSASGDGGQTWDAARQINTAFAAGQYSRYATVHANGAKVYVAGRTVDFSFFGIFATFHTFTVRSLDGGVTWRDLSEQAKAMGAEYGVSLAGQGDDLLLAYEQSGSVYTRQSSDGQAWSAALSLGAGEWPSVTRASDGRGWAAWENNGSLLLQRYTGSSWDSAQTVMAGSGLCKAFYPNLKLGTSAGRVEWVTGVCPGSPYRMLVDGQALADMPVDPPLQFSAAEYSVSEGAGTVPIEVTLGAATTAPVTVTYSTGNGTAIVNRDFFAANGTLVFAPGVRSKTFGVTIRANTIDEPDRAFTLVLSNPVNAVAGTPLTATVTIKDDDPPPAVVFSTTSYAVHENAGLGSATVHLQSTSAWTVTVDYATSDGPAVAGNDYVATRGTLTFAPGDINKSFNVPIIDDVLAEPNETMTLKLSNPVNATLGSANGATLLIWANDTVTYSSVSSYVHENVGSAIVSIRLNDVSSQPVTVDYATADGTAVAGSDYVATSGTLTFAPGDTTETLSVAVVDDVLPEANETLLLSLRNPANAGLGSPYTATLSIYANDALTFGSSAYFMQENAGVATITVKLSGPSSLPVSVDFATSNGTAVAGGDYVASSGTLTFAPGETNKTFSVPIVDDVLPEANETINLTLSNLVNAGLGSPSTASITIWANDALAFTLSAINVQENAGLASVTVKLSGPSSSAVSVDYATSDGTATAGSDYVTTSDTLTFAPGETNKTFYVPISDDILPEPNETVNLRLSNSVNAGFGSPYTATLTILANDALLFGSSTYYVQENAGAASITVKLSGPSSVPVSVDYALSNGTGSGDSDYVASSGTLAFATGETSKSFSVPIIDDILAEPNETINLQLSNPLNAGLGSPSTAIITIWANDQVSYNVSKYSVHENAGTVQATIKLSAASSVPVSVDYSTANGTAVAGNDYVATSGTVTFAAGETYESFAVTIIDDVLAEADETFVLNLSNPANAGFGSPVTATVVIYANDALSFSTSSYLAQENAGAATITVRLSGPSSLIVSVDYATSDGTALAGPDYRATSGTLVFRPGETSKTFTVPIINDGVPEPMQVFYLGLSNPVNASLGSQSTSSAAILAHTY